MIIYKWSLNYEFWILKWFRMAPKMLPKSSKNRSNQVPDGHWIANWVRWRFWDAVRRQNFDHFGPKIGRKSSLDSFKIESDAFPDAFLKQKAFQKRFYVKIDRILKALRKQELFKTLRMSSKNGFRVYMIQNAVNNALIIRFSSQIGSKFNSKSLP